MLQERHAILVKDHLRKIKETIAPNSSTPKWHINVILRIELYVQLVIIQPFKYILKTHIKIM